MKIEENRYSDIFLRLKEKQSEVRTSSAMDRIKKLKKLKEAVSITHKQRIRDALYADFKKPQLEVDFTEILPFVEEIDYVIKRLPFWLKRQKVSTPISLFGSSSYIKYESKGVCLIISPWNFPVNLTLIPLVSAVAAGNSVILKPSEFTPHTSALMEEIIKEVFDENEVVLIRGEVETSKELLKLPFNHIFFTGSPTVGKKVMEAASKHLTSVTLELGGKSPCIIDKDVDVKKTVNKIAFGKFMNAGQTCIAPDYVFVHESVREQVLDELKKTISEFYPQIKEGSSYVELVNEKHYERIKGFIDDAKGKNASVYQQETFSSECNFIGPTLISNVNEDMEIMKEEIFGPILPIKSFKE
ncbi:MAG: aldehyde dehydrogenase family protein, partial [Flavobacteriaceae bacterium]|nr:aldehyde dehydrogenase family protein [Flavobacteriaceae bacterium]